MLKIQSVRPNVNYLFLISYTSIIETWKKNDKNDMGANKKFDLDKTKQGKQHLKEAKKISKKPVFSFLLKVNLRLKYCMVKIGSRRNKKIQKSTHTHPFSFTKMRGAV